MVLSIMISWETVLEDTKAFAKKDPNFQMKPVQGMTEQQDQSTVNDVMFEDCPRQSEQK